VAFDYKRLKNWHIPPVVHRYTRDEAMLYALGVGYGYDPTDERQLRYVYEKDFVTAPTFAVVLGFPGSWMSDPATGIDWVKVVHGEQSLTIHNPLPPEGVVVGKTRVKSIVDKGPGKGALVYSERLIEEQATGTLLATLEQVSFCRGDGGLLHSDTPVPAPVATPDTAPDAICDLPTIAQSALLYRLSADRNPLHADPSVAKQAGFARPILHGLCTFGVAAHALLRTYCDYDARRLQSLSVRFSSPVYPGETIRTECWHDAEVVRFRARVLERDVIVLSHGVAGLQA
jgi:acyl dehydratase